MKRSRFLESIQSYSGGVSTAELFAGDGRSVCHSVAHRSQNPVYKLAKLRFREALGDAIHGGRASSNYISALREGNIYAWQKLVSGAKQSKRLHEAISTSDFPLLFGDTIDRILLAKYQEHVPTWEDYMKISTVRDFRDVKRFKASPGRGLLPVVAQGASYQGDIPSELSYSFAVTKYGSVRNIFWEALVNDDLGALSDVPNDFAFMAAQTEWNVATALFAANTTLYAAAHAGPVAGTTFSNFGTAELTTESLAAALSQMGDYPGDDADGTPVMNDVRYLVVGTAGMKFKAEQILNSPVVIFTGASDRDNLPTNNLISPDVRNNIQVRLNPFLRLQDATNYQTSWYLFADPNFGYAVEFARLAGYEAPSLFVRADTQVMLGGLASPADGGFDNDAVDYKVRHVMGGSHTNAVGGWRFSYFSNGTV